MFCKRFLMVMVLAGLGTVARAQDFGLDIGSFSDPLTDATVNVDEHGGGAFGYYNSLDTLITELSFTVDVGLGKSVGSYNCTSYNFFKTCTTAYDATDGILTFDFSGVNSADNDEGPTGTDNEAHGEFEGLPTVPEGCLASPDSPSCVAIGPYKGHFLISFNSVTEGNPLNAQDGSGDWAPGTAAQLSTVNGKSVPEPSSLVFLGTSLLLVAGIVRRRARRA